MCGIAGIISQKSPTSNAVESAGELMRHRGPDSFGVRKTGAATLIFRRLAIIDLSPSGDQPMANETGDVVVVFNGEIYNFALLRSQLQVSHDFKSKTDTEVLVHGYEEWGFEELLRRIDGMFAFAIWDQRVGALFLARDRAGKKPLYYRERDDELLFGSTLSSLAALDRDVPIIDPISLDQYLIYQAVPAPRTIFDGISMLPPAYWMRWKSGEPTRRERYWKLSYGNKVRRSESDTLEELDRLLRAAVERRLISDVPLGAFLSGGVDSSIVVGMMSALGRGPVEAVNIGFDDPAFDERPLARIVARRWGAHLHEHVMRADEVQRLPEIIWHYGQPLADVSIVPTYAVARAAREHVTVVLNGDGGDEAFGGYARPLVMRSAETLRRTLPRSMLSMPIAITRLLGKRGRMLARAASRPGRDSFIYERGLRNFRAQFYAPEYLQRLEGHDPDEHYREAWQGADGSTDTDRALFGDFTTYLPDQLLVKMDVSTMAHSVEARSPLLDTSVLEFAASIPVPLLLNRYRTKYLLKRLAERYAPREVIYRRKRGFVMPASAWLRGPIAGPLARILASREFAARGLFRYDSLQLAIQEHLTGVRDWGGVLWTILVLEIWFRLFIDKTITKDQRLEDIQ